MHPLKILLAAPLLLPIAAKKPPGCKADKPFKTEIVINLNIPDTRYNYQLSMAQLTQEQTETTKKWQNKQEDHVWASADLMVDGLARGGVGVEQQTHFLAKPYDRYGRYYCPYVKKIVIDVNYNSRIFIASDRKQGSCEFFAVLDHEHKHHNANVTVVKNVVERLKKDLPTILRDLERGYVPRSEVDGGFNNLQEGLTDMMKVYSAYMFENMEKENEPIDTPAEYERVHAACP